VNGHAGCAEQAYAVIRKILRILPAKNGLQSLIRLAHLGAIVLIWYCGGVPDVIGSARLNVAANLSQQQYDGAFRTAQISHMQWNTQVFAHVVTARKQQGGRWRVYYGASHAPVTLLLDRQHRRQCVFGEHPAMGIANLRQQLFPDSIACG
jgi:hypothetical protein